MIFDSIHHIAIIASDYDKAKEFYVDKLGFKVKREVERKERENLLTRKEDSENKTHFLDTGGRSNEMSSFPSKQK